MAPVVQLRMMNYPFPPGSPELVPSLFEESIHCIPKLIEIGSAILLIQPYKCLPVTTKMFT